MRSRKALTVGEKVGHIDALLAIERELRSLLDSRLESHGITYAQLAVLRYIRDPVDAYHRPLSTPIALQMVKEWFQYAPRTMTDAANLLHSRGFVERIPSPSDRRSVLLIASAMGSELIDVTQPIIERTHLDITRHMSRSLALSLQGTLRLLRAGIGRSAAADRRRNPKPKIPTPC